MRKWFIKAFRIGLVAAAALFLVLAIATLLAESWWVFDLTTHPRLQYLVAGTVLLLLALAVGPRWAALPILVAVGIHIAAVAPLLTQPAPAAAKAAKPGIPLRVMTVNVHWWNRRHAAVADYVRKEDPDIVVIQEAAGEWSTGLPQIGSRYPYAVPPKWQNGAEVIIFSRHPIIKWRTVNPPRGGFPIQVAELQVLGRRLVVIGVHTLPPIGNDLSAARNAHLEDLTALARNAGAAVIMAGDFNLTPWSPYYRRLVREAGLTSAARGKLWQPTWPAWFPLAGLPIDHVFVKGGIRIRSSRNGPDVGSDHYPLVADLVLTPTRQR